jgi:hypothetical protein
MSKLDELKSRKTLLTAKINTLKNELLSVQEELVQLELKDVRGKTFINKRYGKCRVVNIQDGYIQLKRIKVNNEEFKIISKTAYRLERFLKESKEV